MEVAHIQPVHEGGRSSIGNLLVLCPNHHKEFDLGELKLESGAQVGNEFTKVAGTINGRPFSIRLTLEHLKRQYGILEEVESHIEVGQ